MGESSINSSFKFESYKIDYIHFEMKKLYELLASQGNIDPKAWQFSINIGKPLFSKGQSKYISSIKAGLMLMPAPAADAEAKAEPDEPLVMCELTVTGIFSVEKDRIDKKVEMNVVKLHFPSLLLPYARSAITSILAHAGFGSIILPLINMHAIAKGVEAELEPEEVD